VTLVREMGVSRLLAKVALWVQIRTFFKSQKLTTLQKSGQYTLAAEKNILKVMRLISQFYYFAISYQMFEI
jgi:hypothetical protein